MTCCWEWKPSGQAQETPQNLPAPDQAENKDGNLNSANPESGSDWSEAGLRSGEANTSKKSCGCSGQDAHDSETTKEGDNDRIGAGEQRGGIRKEKG